MELEFSRIIGHDHLKKQLRKFYKTFQLDRFRRAAAKPLYHMIFSGPPGTGKTTMAGVVSRIMVAMGLLASNKVVVVQNALELVGQYTGQTPPKVQAKFDEAKGGILFIDEAYSLVESGSLGYGREAVDTIMRNLDPPVAVCIFAGYEEPIATFLKANEGLARRVPYHYRFEAYTIDQLAAIARATAASLGETLDAAIDDGYLIDILCSIDSHIRATQNGGLVANWLRFAQSERDDRLEIHEVQAQPELATTLARCDTTKAMLQLREPRLSSNESSNDHIPV